MTTEEPATDPTNEGEEFIEAQPGRMPTPDEDAAAERGAADVDLDAVTEHEREMLERGASVQGEGQVDP
jgi:hypothetical protein